ncbi:MAG: tetratricopeptide repeat protein [Alphaproteobacteria bacterium]|nr:tetratricopeptide repeat protein [Alphaproteobacteria bacterium]
MARRNRSQKIHRDRAKSRARSPRPEPEPPSGDEIAEQLREWVDEAYDLLNATLEDLQRIDLTDYLRRTAEVDLSPAERLRQLAIALEFDAHWHPQPRGWLALARIYDLAERLDPEDWGVPHSRGISAMECAEDPLDEHPETSHPLYDVAREAFLRALAPSNEDIDVLHALGDLCYYDRRNPKEDAIAWYDRVLEKDPKHAWANLYRAHALHDLERWSEAVAAYDAVNPAEFQGPPSWRMHLLVEQRGQCRYRAGDVEGAMADFDRILTRYERNPKLMTDHCLPAPGTLEVMMEEPLRAALFERLRALEARVDEDWGLEDGESEE